MTPALLRHGALAGRAVAAEAAIAATCAHHGATIVAPGAARVDTLVFDAATLFADGDREGLRAALDGAWKAVHAVATAQWCTPEAAGAGGKIVLVGPRAAAGEYAGAAAAGLENLARTLAVEWARYGVRATAIVPGPRTSEDELAALVAFLASAGGEYFSGCRFSLR
jgi:NAD(P)-dependent dehydrogenase (short-subunit alcohol dehydrogenase family)